MIFLVPLCAAIYFSLFALWRVVCFNKEHGVLRRWKGDFPVCVLRPLHHADAETEKILATLCMQHTPPTEIRYGVDDPLDLSTAVAQRLKEHFPGIPAAISVGKRPRIANGKIANLSVLTQGVSAPVLVALDQDIAVEPSYLEEILSPFFDPATGLVTCAYRVANPDNVYSAFELLSVHCDFFPSILAAERMEKGLRFAFGATMAIRREVLEKIGGFESLGEYLADDHELGARVAGMGRKVVLSRVVVEHAPGKLGARDLWKRQLRAARTHRVCRPGGYALSLLTHGVPWLAGLFSLAGFSPLTLGFASFWLAARAALACASHAVLTGGKGRWWPLLLLPLHEFLRFGFWLLAFSGNQVSWGEKIYTVRRNGTMAPREGFKLRNPE